MLSMHVNILVFHTLIQFTQITNNSLGVTYKSNALAQSSSASIQQDNTAAAASKQRYSCTDLAHEGVVERLELAAAERGAVSSAHQLLHHRADVEQRVAVDGREALV